MEKTISTYRVEIEEIYIKLSDYIKRRKEVHYEIRPAADGPTPYIAIITKDIDYIDGTRLEAFEKIVKENCTQSIYEWGIEGCSMIVKTETGQYIKAFGLKILFTFYERTKEETK